MSAEVIHGKFEFFDGHELLVDIERFNPKFDKSLPALRKDTGDLRVYIPSLELANLLPGISKIIEETVIVEQVTCYTFFDFVDGVFSCEH